MQTQFRFCCFHALSLRHIGISVVQYCIRWSADHCPHMSQQNDPKHQQFAGRDILPFCRFVYAHKTTRSVVSAAVASNEESAAAVVRLGGQLCIALRHQRSPDSWIWGFCHHCQGISYNATCCSLLRDRKKNVGPPRAPLTNTWDRRKGQRYVSPNSDFKYRSLM